jgi:hypothetical protein
MLLSALVLMSSAVGCGDNGDGGSKASQQPQSSPPPAPATSPPATATTPPVTATTPPATSTTPTATTGEPGPAGAGDEEPIRVPAVFTIQGTAITPERVTVPAFLSVDVTLTAKGGAQRVTVAAPGGGAFDVAAGGTHHTKLSGLPPGDYAVTTAAGGRATLHVVRGGAPGP